MASDFSQRKPVHRSLISGPEDDITGCDDHGGRRAVHHVDGLAKRRANPPMAASTKRRFLRCIGLRANAGCASSAAVKERCSRPSALQIPSTCRRHSEEDILLFLTSTLAINLTRAALAALAKAAYVSSNQNSARNQSTKPPSRALFSFKKEFITS